MRLKPLDSAAKGPIGGVRVVMNGRVVGEEREASRLVVCGGGSGSGERVLKAVEAGGERRRDARVVDRWMEEYAIDNLFSGWLLAPPYIQSGPLGKSMTLELTGSFISTALEFNVSLCVCSELLSASGDLTVTHI